MALVLALGVASVVLPYLTFRVFWQSRRTTSTPTSPDLSQACRSHLVQALALGVSGIEPRRCCVILSGGVDTGAVVCAAAEAGVQVTAAITVLTSEAATDRPYAEAIAKALGIKHYPINISLPELLNRQLPACVRALQTFDGMELRNAIVVSEALHKAAELGFDLALTGDAADELLGGYSFTWASEDPLWSEKRAQMCSQWTFCAPMIAKALNSKMQPGKQFQVFSPYMHETFTEWALNKTNKTDCIGTREVHATPSMRPEAHRTGKIPLREAFPESFSAWRRKDPIEVGSGSTELSTPTFWTDLIAADELESEKKLIAEDGITIRDSEHLWYYREFLKQFPQGIVPGIERHGNDPCSGCGYQLRHPQGLFCHVCGMYPARRV